VIIARRCAPAIIASHRSSGRYLTSALCSHANRLKVDLFGALDSERRQHPFGGTQGRLRDADVLLPHRDRAMLATSPWQCSSGGSGRGSGCSSWAAPDGEILTATANRAGSPCDSTGSRSPASPAPWRSGPAARSGTAKPKAADLWRRAEGDLALPPQDAHLMPKGDELKLQRGAATNTEGEQGSEGGKNRDHAHDGMAPTQKSLFSFADLKF
jgi:hypothetical protein